MFTDEEVSSENEEENRYTSSDDDFCTISPRNILCTLGLVPFLAWFIMSGSAVALVVFLNGVVFHLLLPRSLCMKMFDICCNVILVVVINILAWNLIVGIMSCVAALVFLFNSLGGLHGIGKSAIHVLGVQLPLCIALVVAEAKKPYVSVFDV